MRRDLERCLLLGLTIGLIGLPLDSSLADESSSSAKLPTWIWAAGAGDGDRVELQSQFAVALPVTKAVARIAAEFCSVEVELNGRVAFLVEPYAPWVDVDVAQYLVNGRNQLLLRCRDVEGPSAILCEVNVPSAGNTTQHLSDTTWQCRVMHQAAAAGAAPATVRCESFGQVEPWLWGVGVRSIDVDAFDDYEQWRQALGGGETDPATFQLPDGFEIERVRLAGADEGSWISMEFDPQGRLIVAREDKGLLRMTLAEDGRSVTSVEPIPAAAELLECRGVSFGGNDLYVNANNSKGMYVLRDPAGTGDFETAALLREFPGEKGHGRNDLIVVNGDIYSMHGDSVELPTTDVWDMTSPFRAAARGPKPSTGSLVKLRPEMDRCRIVVAGLRNAYGIARHPTHGTLFTYDADNEVDMGTPWYRPTRILHLQEGGDFGWRGSSLKWPPYYADRADNALPVMTIGKGSPTCVKFGEKSNFPRPYRDALYVLDWAYGRVLAVHLIPRGESYYARAEVFLRGRPLNVTDLDFGRDGAMYLVTGGRKTQSALYRVSYTGRTRPDPTDSAMHDRWEVACPWSPQYRRNPIMDRIRNDPFLWHELQLVSSDPAVMNRLRSQVESRLNVRPARTQADSLRGSFGAEHPNLLNALLVGADLGTIAGPVIERLNELELTTLSTSDKLLALRAYATCLEHSDLLPADLKEECRWRLNTCYPDSAPLTFAPTGLGGPVNNRLVELLVQLDSPDVVAKTMRLLASTSRQEDRMHYLYVLRNVPHGWTPELRTDYFTALNDLERNSRGGRGMPTFLQNLRADAIASLSENERQTLGDLLLSPANAPEEPLPARAFVRDWTPDDLTELVAADSAQADTERGEKLFREAVCSRCHRAGTVGTMFGPDLTSVAARFSRQDILRSILDPSAVVAENYRNVEVLTKDGRQVVGQLVTSGDYRESVLRIQTDPLRPSQVTEVLKSDVELHRESPTSPMPRGLLNTLTREEIGDLLAFLEQCGKEN